MLSVKLFGTLQVKSGENPVASFRSIKSVALLVYLLLESNRDHTRSGLATLIWPEQTAGAARKNLSQTWRRLCADLGDDSRASRYFQTTRTTIGIRPDAPISCDIAQFQAAIERVAKHTHHATAECEVCLAELRKAVDVGLGEFLSGFDIGADAAPFEEWLMRKREMLHQQMLQALFDIAEGALGAGQFDLAADYAHRQLAMEPWRERAFQQLIAALIAGGEREQALLQFERCRAVLLDELGLTPSAETSNLIASIQLTGDPTIVNSANSNVGTPTTPLVGRSQEIAAIVARLSDGDERLITLVGQGGVGKTRLSLELAHRLRDKFADGVWLIELAGSNMRELVTSLSNTLDINFRGTGNREQQVIAALHDRDMLLVLDNFEDVLDEAVVVANLLKQTQRLKVLCTSREPLHVRGESIVRLSGLAQPRPDAPAPDAFDSVQFFVQSARQSNHQFELTPENVKAVAAICRFVDGSPLGIELAAAWAQQQSPVQLLAMMQQSPDVLQTRQRDVPARQRSMRIVFEQSWLALDDIQRRILARLSVFSAEFSIESATAVAQSNPFALSTLVDKSLVWSQNGSYRLHPLVKLFSAEKLAADSPTHSIYSRYFLKQAALQETALRGEDGRTAALQFGRIYDDLIQAWHIALREGDIASLDAAFRACLHYWALRGLLDEGIVLLETTINQLSNVSDSGNLRHRLQAHVAGLLVGADRYEEAAASAQAAQDSADIGTRGWAWMYYGSALWQKMERDVAYANYERALDAFQQFDNQMGIGRTLIQMSIYTTARNENDLAHEQLAQALRYCRTVGDAWGEAAALTRLCILTQRQDAREDCIYWGTRALEMCAKTGDRQISAAVLNVLGQLAMLEKRQEEALTLLRRAEQINEELNLLLNAMFTNWFLGSTLREMQQFEESESVLQKALSLAQQLNHSWWESYVLLELATLASESGRRLTGQKLLKESIALAEEIGNEGVLGEVIKRDLMVDVEAIETV